MLHSSCLARTKSAFTRQGSGGCIGRLAALTTRRRSTWFRAASTRSISRAIITGWSRIPAEARSPYNLQPLSSELHVGDVLAVRVTVGGNEARYLLVEDPIPAGAEFIERDELYEFRQKPAWWESWWTRREFPDERAAYLQKQFMPNHDYL